METIPLFLRFGAALAIGILIGLQREYALGGEDQELLAGVRTFALMSLAGCAGALASDVLQSVWPLVAVFLVIGMLMTAAYFLDAIRGGVGLTTEVAALLTILVGAFSYWELYALAVGSGVTITVLLSLKLELQRFVQHITTEDIFATLKFAVITAIVLPVLPNQTFGPPPVDVLNPYTIWLMVVFISGISFLGYVLIKFLGPRQGIGLTGLLGGLVSSTAVTLTFAQRSGQEEDLARPLALAIIVSWTTMFIRVLVVVVALNFLLARLLLWPMVAATAAGLAYCGYLYYQQRSDQEANINFANPFELRPALQFGLLYALILVVSRAGQHFLGDVGVYVSSVAAGLVDLNAISLSLAELSRAGGGVSLATAARAIVLATIANTAVKGIIVLAVGAAGLRRYVLPGFILILFTAASVVLLLT
jgi:uncharacterized membrane protein (DUF4010 family)